MICQWQNRPYFLVKKKTCWQLWRLSIVSKRFQSLALISTGQSELKIEGGELTTNSSWICIGHSRCQNLKYKILSSGNGREYKIVIARNTSERLEVYNEESYSSLLRYDSLISSHVDERWWLCSWKRSESMSVCLISLSCYSCVFKVW